MKESLNKRSLERELGEGNSGNSGKPVWELWKLCKWKRGTGKKRERMYSIWRRDQHFLTDKVSGTRKTEHMDLEVLGMWY